MATAGLSAELSCSICHEIYTEPVTLPCGHNFCLRCIETTWDRQQEIKEHPSCPECRQTYRRRPKLNMNQTLSSLVQSLLPTVPEPHGPGIYCTCCKRRRVTACSTCLLCNVSLCYEHAMKHNKSAEHQLTAPTPSQKDRYCPKHPELLLEYYCPQDGVCICASCYRVGQHRGHSVEPLNGETAEKKKEKLREVLEKLSPEREETEGQIQRLQERRREVEEKAANETERVTVLINDLIKQMKTLRRQIIGKISRKKLRLSVPLKDLIQELEIKKDKVSRKIHHIEELCNMEGPLTVLQARDSHGDEFYGAEGGDRKRRKIEDLDFSCVNDMYGGVTIDSLFMGLCDVQSGLQGLSSPGQEATDLVLDINTAGNNVIVSEDRKTATDSHTDQGYPPTPKRFRDENQILSVNTFSSGHHYWDVECSQTLLEWGVGVAYPRIKRAEYFSWIGNNEDSWALYREDDKYSARHDNKQINLLLKPSCGRIRISLNYDEDSLSFYELSEPIRHLHTFTAFFIEPLHAVFRVWGSSVRIISSDSTSTCPLEGDIMK